MKTNSHDCEECVHCDFRIYDKYSPEEPYCLIYERFIIDMLHHNITCYDFEPVEEDNND